jgi:hypothetical protein
VIARAAVLDERASSQPSKSPALQCWWLRGSKEGSGAQRAIRARDVRAADLQAKPTRRVQKRSDPAAQRFVGFAEDGGYLANIAASGASQ